MRNWSMRFEAKHRYFKQLAQTIGCFKNITKTLTLRHQRLQCYWLSESDCYLKRDIEVGPGTKNRQKTSVCTYSSHFPIEQGTGSS